MPWEAVKINGRTYQAKSFFRRQKKIDRTNIEVVRCDGHKTVLPVEIRNVFNTMRIIYCVNKPLKFLQD